MTKPVLVLLPGYDGNSHSFTSILPTLNHQFSPTCLDFPFIHTDDRAYSMDELAEYVHEKTKKLKPFYLAGFSMGGMIATRYAELFPGRVRSLLLISSTVHLADHVHANPVVRIGLNLSRSRVLSNSFAYVYSAQLLKHLLRHTPLPIPQVAIPARQGYSYFGTLGQVIRDTRRHTYIQGLHTLKMPKSAFLCEDDMSFPAHDYQSILEKYGFANTVHEKGGHATGDTYWHDVADFLVQKIPRRSEGSFYRTTPNKFGISDNKIN